MCRMLAHCDDSGQQRIKWLVVDLQNKGWQSGRELGMTALELNYIQERCSDEYDGKCKQIKGLSALTTPVISSLLSEDNTSILNCVVTCKQ